MNRTYLVTAGLALSLALPSLRCDARTLKLEDYLDLERVSAPQIAPDGKTIVYARSWVNGQEDRFDTELWVMDADGSRNRRLLAGASQADWSKDSKRIAYVADGDHGSQIFVRWMDAQSSTSQITHIAAKPEDLRWSPDGKWIAFMAKVPAKPQWTITLPDRPKDAHWTADAVVIDKLHYRLDRVGVVEQGYSHVFVVPADGGTPRQLTSGNWNAEPRKAGMPYYRGTLEWTPDGKSILFAADRGPDSESRYGRSGLYAVAVADGGIRTIVDKDGFWGIAPGPRVSPDGKSVAYLGTQASSTSNYPSLELHVARIDGSDERTLSADLPSDVSYLHWAKDGKSLYYVTGREGANGVYTVSLNGAVRAVTSGSRSIELASVSDDDIAVGTLTTAVRPADIVRLSLPGSKDLRTLTAVNEDVLADVQLGKVEEIWYDSSDNTKVQGWIVYPPDFDPSKKYPLLLNIHGGPEGMYAGTFNFDFQDMAAHGYVVLYTNPRGSTGYGGTFARAIYNAYPGRFDYQDLMSGVDKVVGRGFIDPERMYVEGCSGGGTLTAWVVTQTDRFAGAAALCPIVNMISFAGATDIPGWAFNRYEKPFWEDPTAWLASSSIMHINHVKTPTLVMVGELDSRTPVDQSEELYTALKMVNVPTTLILLKDEWHGTTSKPSNMLRTQLYVRKWFGGWRRVMEDGKPTWRNVESSNP